MATTELAVQDLSRSGLDAVYSAADGGDGNVFNNDGGRIFVHVKNGSGGGVDVTIATPGTADGLTIADRVVNVPAGEDRFIGGFTALYEAADADNSIDKAVLLTFSAVTSVTLAVLRLPRS